MSRPHVTNADDSQTPSKGQIALSCFPSANARSTTCTARDEDHLPTSAERAAQQDFLFGSCAFDALGKGTATFCPTTSQGLTMVFTQQDLANVQSTTEHHWNFSHSSSLTFLAKLKSQPTDIDSWMGYLRCLEAGNSGTKLETAYEHFLVEYPLCYGYWQRYAKHILETCDNDATDEAGDNLTRRDNLKYDKAREILERGLRNIPYCEPLWRSYCNIVVQSHMRRNSQADTACSKTPQKPSNATLVVDYPRSAFRSLPVECIDDIRKAFSEGLRHVGFMSSSTEFWTELIDFESALHGNEKRVNELYQWCLNVPQNDGIDATALKYVKFIEKIKSREMLQSFLNESEMPSYNQVVDEFERESDTKKAAELKQRLTREREAMKMEEGRTRMALAASCFDEKMKGRSESLVGIVSASHENKSSECKKARDLSTVKVAKGTANGSGFKTTRASLDDEESRLDELFEDMISDRDGSGSAFGKLNPTRLSEWPEAERAEYLRQEVVGEATRRDQSEREQTRELLWTLKLWYKSRMEAIVAVTREHIAARAEYEGNASVPHFTGKLLDKSQITSWNNYLDFELSLPNNSHRAVLLFERCLIPCAHNSYFWKKYASWMYSGRPTGPHWKSSITSKLTICSPLCDEAMSDEQTVGEQGGGGDGLQGPLTLNGASLADDLVFCTWRMLPNTSDDTAGAVTPRVAHKPSQVAHCADDGTHNDPKSDKEDKVSNARLVLRRGTEICARRNLDLLLYHADFEEAHGNFQGASEIYDRITTIIPRSIRAAKCRAAFERRQLLQSLSGGKCEDQVSVATVCGAVFKKHIAIISSEMMAIDELWASATATSKSLRAASSWRQQDDDDPSSQAVVFEEEARRTHDMALWRKSKDEMIVALAEFLSYVGKDDAKAIAVLQEEMDRKGDVNGGLRFPLIKAMKKILLKSSKLEEAVALLEAYLRSAFSHLNKPAQDDGVAEAETGLSLSDVSDGEETVYVAHVLEAFGYYLELLPYTCYDVNILAMAKSQFENFIKHHRTAAKLNRDVDDKRNLILEEVAPKIYKKLRRYVGLVG